MMKTRTAFLAALLAAASAAPAQDQKPQEEELLTLTCKEPRFRGRGGRLELDGRAEFPDYTVLSITVHRMEAVYAHPKLINGSSGGRSGLAQVMRKKLKFAMPVPAAGVFSIDVKILDDLQRPDVLEKIKKKTPRRAWNQKFNLWGDHLLQRLGPAVQRIDNLASESLSIIEKFEKACENEATWMSQKKKLTKDGEKLLSKIEKDDVKQVLPAAHSQVYFTIHNVVSTARFFVFENGEFKGGQSYHATNGTIDTHRDEDFSYPNLKKYLIDASRVAGRELALWAVRDILKSEGNRSRHLTDAINTYNSHPGLAPYSDQLLEAPIEELKLLEKMVMSEKG